GLSVSKDLRVGCRRQSIERAFLREARGSRARAGLRRHLGRPSDVCRSPFTRHGDRTVTLRFICAIRPAHRSCEGAFPPHARAPPTPLEHAAGALSRCRRLTAYATAWPLGVAPRAAQVASFRTRSTCIDAFGPKRRTRTEARGSSRGRSPLD